MFLLVKQIIYFHLLSYLINYSYKLVIFKPTYPFFPKVTGDIISTFYIFTQTGYTSRIKGHLFQSTAYFLYKKILEPYSITHMIYTTDVLF